MMTIPTQAVPSQALGVVLANQNCVIDIYQNLYGVFLDLYVNDSLIIGGVICENANRVVRDAYLGFVGDLAFYDTQGIDDPDYTGFGSRWQLVYLEASDLAAEGFSG